MWLSSEDVCVFSRIHSVTLENTCKYTHVAKVNVSCVFYTHLLLSRYTSVINSFNPLSLHLTQFKSMACMIRLWRSIYFLYRRLKVVTTHVCVIRSWSCVYMAIHTRMPRHACLYICVVLHVFHKPQACHTWVFCMYTFCVCLSWEWLVLYIATYVQ